jgi:hypothetical protein
MQHQGAGTAGCDHCDRDRDTNAGRIAAASRIVGDTIGADFLPGRDTKPRVVLINSPTIGMSNAVRGTNGNRAFITGTKSGPDRHPLGHVRYRVE